MFIVEKSLRSPNWTNVGTRDTREEAEQLVADMADYYEPGEYDGSLFSYRIREDGDTVEGAMS